MTSWGYGIVSHRMQTSTHQSITKVSIPTSLFSCNKNPIKQKPSHTFDTFHMNQIYVRKNLSTLTLTTGEYYKKLMPFYYMHSTVALLTNHMLHQDFTNTIS